MNQTASRGLQIIRQINAEIQDKTHQIAGSFALIPALFTWIRFLGAGFIVYILWQSLDQRLIFWTILICALSDYADGWVARRLKKTTYPGKVMDFTADKLFLSVALISVSYHLGALDTLVGGLLTGYHLVLLFALSVISWSVHVPVVTITTGERLAVLFSYLLLITATGRMIFPHKQIYGSLYFPLCIFAVLSAVAGLISYLRLLKRVLGRVLVS